jgi:hypothetical protein
MKRNSAWLAALPFVGLALVLLAHYAANSSLAMAIRVVGIALCIAYFAIRPRQK